MRIVTVYYERQALKAMMEDRWESAEQYLRKLEDRPGNKGTMGFNYNLGICLLAQKKFEEAQELFLENVSSFGESLRTCRVLGDLYYEWGRREKALDWYQKALEDEPGERERRFLQIRIDLSSDPGMFERAYGAQALLEEARSLRKSDPKEALKLYREVAERDRSNVEALSAAGSLLLEQGENADDALSYLRAADGLIASDQVTRMIEKAEKMVR